MSSNNISMTETAQSQGCVALTLPPLPPPPPFVRPYNYQSHSLAANRPLAQQPSSQGQQQRQHTNYVLQMPQQQQQQQEQEQQPPPPQLQAASVNSISNSSANMRNGQWAGSFCQRTGVTDNLCWNNQDMPPQQQQNYNNQSPFYSHKRSLISGAGGSSALANASCHSSAANDATADMGWAHYITAEDIPPPPPPQSKYIIDDGSSAAAGGGLAVVACGTGKRFGQQQQPPPHCQCEHPIKILLPNTGEHQHQHYHHQHSQPNANNTKSLPLQQKQQQQHQQQAQLQKCHHSHSYNNNNNNNNNNAQHPQNQAISREHHILHAQFQENHCRSSQQRLLPLTLPLNKNVVGQNTNANAPQKNLVYSQGKIRKLRVLLGVLFAVVVLTLLATAFFFIFRNTDSDEPSSAGIRLEDILTGQLVAKSFNASWSTGNNLMYTEHNQIVEYDVKTKKKSILLVDLLQQYLLHEKSADGQYLLLAKQFKKNFRYSYEAIYDILNITSGELQPLKIKGEQKSLIMVQWAPVGNALLINFERNLYYKPHALAEEITITNDDNPAVLNGVPDWVYEEEIFSSNSATWFNPNGTMIAFIQFDDSPTHVINFPYYGEPGDLHYQYPFNRLVAYPKAGSSNPIVRLFTADLVNLVGGLEHLKPIPLPSALNTQTDNIITVVSWLDDTSVLSVWMNRLQNQAYLQISDTVKRTELFNIVAKNGWVDLFAAPHKNRDGSRIALILPQRQLDGGKYYRHLCTLATGSGSNSKPEALTKGKYVVQSVLHWDAGSDVIFYTANTEQQSNVLHVYAVKAGATGQTPVCLTCNLQISGAVKQTYYTADFNTRNEVVVSSLGPGIPMHSIYEWSYANGQVNLSKLMDWETNGHLRAKLANIAMPSIEIHTFPIAGNFTAKVLLQLPPNLDRSGATKYPMLVDVYGGPDSYSVVDKWNINWGTYLSSNRSVIYAKIDGRGSGLRGDELLHAIYLQLGTLEITDQIEVAKQLQQKFDFIHPNQTGIWGWSYGGYAASMALANDNSSVFHCAASIAPVTDWAYYDSIYTERYMSLPKLNVLGYAASRLTTQAQKLRGKRYLLVHGTLDDNVHYQQSMMLAKNLERHDIQFQQISYPDEDHGLNGVRPHLYHSLDRFFGECFNNKRMMRTK